MSREAITEEDEHGLFQSEFSAAVDHLGDRDRGDRGEERCGGMCLGRLRY